MAKKRLERLKRLAKVKEQKAAEEEQVAKVKAQQEAEEARVRLEQEAQEKMRRDASRSAPTWPPPPPPLCPCEKSEVRWPFIRGSPRGCHCEQPGQRQRTAADSQRLIILP